MGFREDKVRLINEDLENAPTFTEEDEDFDESCLVDTFDVCRVLFCFLAYVAVLGISLFVFMHHGTDEDKSLHKGYRRFYKLKFFKHGDILAEEQSYKPKKTREKVRHHFKPMFPDFRILDSFDPPPRSEKAKTARYIVHNSIWGSISTISVSLNGAPFGLMMSFSDGTVENSTGIPYFYLAAADPVVTNIKANQWASLSLSEAQSDYCKAHNWDPEEPLCSRVTLTGKLVHVGSDEEDFAHKALFTRHPVMKTWPKDHDWQTLKLVITNVWLQDIYGPANIIPVEDYFKVKL